jgi:hypothetical protein
MSQKIMARLRGSVSTYRVLFDKDPLPELGFEVPIGVATAHEYSPVEGAESTYDLYYVVIDQEQKEKMVDPYIEAAGLEAETIRQPEYVFMNAIYKTNGRSLLISRVNNSARIGENGKTLIEFGERSVSTSTISFAVDMPSEIDAYYDGRDRIYFSKFSRAKSLFKDFDDFYQEAWFDAKELFLREELFDVGAINPNDISPQQTSQIEDIRANDKLNLQDKDTIDKIKQYIKTYPLSGVVLTPEGKIKIMTKDDLRCTIKLLTQRYYTSEITGEVLEARGSAKMKDQKANKVFNGVEQMSKD